MTIRHLDNSVLILSPKPAFLEWLKKSAKSQGFEFHKIYFPEQNNVFIIPSVDVFEDTDAFDSFVQEIKPLLLRHVSGAYGFPLREYSIAQFDDFFGIELRDHVSIVESSIS